MPSGRDSEVVVTVVIPVVVEVETLVVEVTEVDTVAVRVQIIAFPHPCHWTLRVTSPPIRGTISFQSCILFKSR